MYTTLPFPYDYWTKQLTPGMAKQALATLLGELPVRIETIQASIGTFGGGLIAPNVSDEQLDGLPKLVAALCGFDASYAPEGLERVFHPYKLDKKSYEVIFDGALLLGEIFRSRYPGSRWEICRTPLSSVHYGQPVLVNDASPKKNEFGPVVVLTGEVGGVLRERPRPEWPLSRLLRMEAYAIGLGPDPMHVR